MERHTDTWNQTFWASPTTSSHAHLPVHCPADWSTSVFNTGQGSQVVNGVTYTGPIGTGPYKFVSYDSNAQVIHLTRNDNYWNASGLKAEGLFTIKDYYIQFVSDGTAALADSKERTSRHARLQLQPTKPSRISRSIMG